MQPRGLYIPGVRDVNSSVLHSLLRPAASQPTFGLAQTIAFAVGLDYMDPMCQPVQQCTSQTLGAHHLGPVLKRQIRRHNQALPLIRSADDFKKQFRANLAEGNN